MVGHGAEEVLLWVNRATTAILHCCGSTNGRALCETCDFPLSPVHRIKSGAKVLSLHSGVGSAIAPNRSSWTLNPQVSTVDIHFTVLCILADSLEFKDKSEKLHTKDQVSLWGQSPGWSPTCHPPTSESPSLGITEVLCVLGNLPIFGSVFCLFLLLQFWVWVWDRALFYSPDWSRMHFNLRQFSCYAQSYRLGYLVVLTLSLRFQFFLWHHLWTWLTLLQELVFLGEKCDWIAEAFWGSQRVL